MSNSLSLSSRKSKIRGKDLMWRMGWGSIFCSPGGECLLLPQAASQWTKVLPKRSWGQALLAVICLSCDIRRHSPHPCNMGSCTGDEGLKVPVQHTRFSYPETRNMSAQTLFMLSLPFLSGVCIHLRDLIWGIVCTWVPRVNYRNIAQHTANLT